MSLIKEFPHNPMDFVYDSQHQLPHFAFVDADNLKKGFEKRLDDLGIPKDHHEKFTFFRIFEQLHYDRIYVYSAVQEGGVLPEWLGELSALTRVVLKLGTLTDNGRAKKQEGVDVKLAVDATRFAFTSTMKCCTIFGADGDFIPLVEAVSDSGCIVNVASFNNPTKGRVAQKLQAVADSYLRITGPWIHRTSDVSRNTVTQAPDAQHNVDWCNPTHTIEMHGARVKVWESDASFYACFDENRKIDIMTSPSLDDLVTWGKLHYKQVT